MAIDSVPKMVYEVAFNTGPNQSTTPPLWTDITNRTQFPWSTLRGRQYELDQNQTGTWNITLDNHDGALDPTNTASPYSPNVVPYRACRVRAIVGPNMLTGNQATAGETTGLPPGVIPAWMNVTSGAGYAVTIVASGTAYQGTQVFQVAVPNSAAAPKDVLDVTQSVVTVGAAYSLTVQARVLATAQNLAMSVSIDWINDTGGVISTSAGSPTTITGGSTTWIALSASGTAPAGAVYATARVILGTTTTATASVQCDGLQFENSSFPTPFQVPNTASVNMFARSVASAGASASPPGPIAGTFSPLQGTVSYVTGLAVSPTGQTSGIAWALPIGAHGGSPGQPIDSTAYPPVSSTSNVNVQVVAGQTYTFSAYFLRSAGGDPTVTCGLEIQWFDTTGANRISGVLGTAVTVTSGGWVRATATGTAPVGAAWMVGDIYLLSPATTVAANTIYVNGLQLEQAGSASAWSDPGFQTQIFNGFVERWPQTWDELSGTYGASQVVAVDAQAALAQYTLSDPFVNEVLALNPNFFYQLNDPAGSTAAADTAGKRVPVPATNSSAGAGSLVFGTGITSVTAGQAFTGSAGPVATFNNNSTTGGPNTQLAETYLDLAKTTATPGPPQTGPWTRLIAFRAATVPPAISSYHLWAANPATWTPSNASTFSFVILGVSGHLQMAVVNASNGGSVYSGTSNICDGNWHLAAIGMDPVGGNIYMFVDGVQVVVTGSLGPPKGVAADVVGALIVPGANTASDGAVADVAHVIELPINLTVAQMTSLYNSWRAASAGESTAARFQRVLTWIGWPLATSITSNPGTTSMGPATDIVGATALQALQDVTTTENGNTFVSVSGVVTFQSRAARYNQQVPAYVFGEKTVAGEYPFDQLVFDYDTSHIANNAAVTQYSSGTVYLAFDGSSPTAGPSQINYFPQTFQRTVNVTSGSEASDAAYYLLSQYKDAHLRASTLLLSPNHVPGLWAAVLNLEIGTRIRVNRRPTNAPQITLDGFVESIGWSWNPASSEVQVTLQISSANLTVYWQLAATHTTLHAAASSGTNTISINALPDAAVNVLKSSLGQGTQLVIDPGLATQETVTIAPGGVPTTTVGYTSATLTLTANLVNNHAINAVVTEPLPAAANNNPAFYDAQSVLGALVTSFAAAASSGTNTITVNALPDAKFNAVASSVPQGYKLRLSPGTANDETVTITATGTPVTYPGYSTVTFTLTANLTHNHAVGDVVCEPLPAGDTNPNQVLATTRLAY